MPAAPGPCPEAFKLLSHSVKSERPLPLAISVDSPEEWAGQFARGYEKSLGYDFTANTPRPDFSFSADPGDRYIRYTKAEGSLITGPHHYPTTEVLRNLGLIDLLPSLSKQLKIISVGEGQSELATTLAKDGFNIKAVDIWYEAKNFPKSAEDARKNTLDGDEIFDYVAKNKLILQAADATKLPYLTASIDMVLSHQLINNLTDEKCFLAIQEMARVIKKGGQARIAFHDHGARIDQMLDRLKAVPWLKIQKIQTGTRATRFGEMAEYLVIIKKTDAAP